MNRLTENLLLFMVGLAISIVTFSGTYTRYVKPSLYPWLTAAAILVLVLALAAIVRDARFWAAGSGHDSSNADPSHHHEHRHSPSVAWLLALPVAVLVFVPAPALGASAGTPAIDSVSGWHRHPFDPLPAERAPELRLTDVLVRLTNDTAHGLDGRLITVVGFTAKHGGHTDLGRFYIICCAADARLHRLELTGPGADTLAAYPDDTWISVEGNVVPGPSPSQTPHLIVSHVQPIAEPADPYEYPS